MIQLDESRPDSLNLQLQLLQRHTQEWQLIFQLEIQARHAIANRHKQEIANSITQINNPLKRSKLLLRHVNELTQLKCSNVIKRQALQERQNQEKAILTEAVLAIPWE